MYIFPPNAPGNRYKLVSDTHYIQQETQTDSYVYLWGIFDGATAKFQIGPSEGAAKGFPEARQWFDVPKPYGPIELTAADTTPAKIAFFANGLVGNCCRVIISSATANTKIWAAVC